MPAALNTTQIGNDILGNYNQFVPTVLDANANALPQFAGQQTQLTRDQLFGNLDVQAFLAQHPEFQEGYDNEIAKGGDPGRWLQQAIGAASYINPTTTPRSGGLLNDYGAATTTLGNQQAAANTQQRTADIADVEALGARANAAFQAANPQLQAQMNLLSGRVNGANTPFSAALPTLGAAPTAGTTAAMQTLATNPTLGPARSAQQTLASTANLGPAANSTLSTAYGSPLMGQLERDAGGALGAFSPLQQQLAQQAQTNLASSGYLTAEGRRTAAQAARQAAADRGVALGNGAIFDEALNSENLRLQRMGVAQQQALAIDANGQAQTTANRGYAANVAGMGNQLSTFNAGQANATDQFNTAARNTFDLTRYGQESQNNQFNANQANSLAQFNTGQQNSFDLNRYGQEAQTNQFNAGQANGLAQYNAGQTNNAAQFNAGQQSQFDLNRYGQEAQNNQFNAQLGAQQGQQQVANQFQLANTYASQAQDPFALVLGRSNATAQGQSAVNGANANTGALMQTYGANPYDPAQVSIYNANYNAQNAAAQGAANRSSATTGAVVGAVGTIAAGALIAF